MADSSEDIAAQYDLLPKLIQNLDRHLIYPLVNFSYGPDEDGEQSKESKQLLLQLLKPTNMIDYVGQLEQDVKGLDEVPEEYSVKRDAALKTRDRLQEETARICELLTDETVINALRSDKVANMSYLKENFQVTVEMVDQLYEFGNFQYSCGTYDQAADLLYRYRVLVWYPIVDTIRT
jgi:translation initiation factor 3 subunit E